MRRDVLVFRCSWCGDSSGPCYLLAAHGDDAEVPEHCPMDGEEDTCKWECIDLEDLVI